MSGLGRLVGRNFTAAEGGPGPRRLNYGAHNDPAHAAFSPSAGRRGSGRRGAVSLRPRASGSRRGHPDPHRGDRFAWTSSERAFGGGRRDLREWPSADAADLRRGEERTADLWVSARRLSRVRAGSSARGDTAAGVHRSARPRGRCGVRDATAGSGVRACTCSRSRRASRDDLDVRRTEGQLRVAECIRSGVSQHRSANGGAPAGADRSRRDAGARHRDEQVPRAGGCRCPGDDRCYRGLQRRGARAGAARHSADRRPGSPSGQRGRVCSGPVDRRASVQRLRRAMAVPGDADGGHPRNWDTRH